MPQLKKIAFLVPRPGMSDEEFGAYWKGTHGPVVAGSPGYAAYRLRYQQNHVVGAMAGAAFDYAGMAEFWLPGDNEDEFATTPTYRERIKPDEERFIDMDRTLSMTAEEHVLLPGSGAAKLVVVRRSEPDRPDIAPGATGLTGVVVNSVLPGSGRLPGARPASEGIVRIDELWFASDAEAVAAIDRLPHGGDWTAFRAREHVFFADGAPVAG